jgi:hypothetical protein
MRTFSTSVCGCHVDRDDDGESTIFALCAWHSRWLQTAGTIVLQSKQEVRITVAAPDTMPDAAAEATRSRRGA